MWNFLLTLWLGGALGTMGSIVGQHLSEQVTWPRQEEVLMMTFMAVLWFIAIPFTLWSDRPNGGE